MARVTIPDKICPHCGGINWYAHPKNGNIEYICAVRAKEYQHDYHRNNREMVRARQLRYYYSHKEQHIKRMKIYRTTERGKEALRKAQQKERDNLTDNYIRQHLYTFIRNTEGIKIVRKNITKEQIEKQRQSIIAFRQLKQLKNQNHDSKSETQENRRQFLRIGQQSSPILYEQWRGDITQRSSKSLSNCYASNSLSDNVQRKFITINSSSNTKNQEEMNTPILYSASEIAMMESALSTGKPVNAIAKELSIQLNRSKSGVEYKLNMLKKAKKEVKLAKIQKSVEKSVDTRESSLRKEAIVSVQTEFQWDVTPKRVVFCGDHVKVYF